MIKALSTRNYQQGWFLIAFVLLLQGCFKIHISPERSASELIGASIDTVIESNEVINGHNKKYRNDPLPWMNKEFIENYYQEV